MILFAGDAHGDFVPLIEEAGEASAVALLGDQEPQVSLVKELGPSVAPKTWWIYGNHYSDYLDYMTHHESMAARNLHCRVVEIEGGRIAGLGGRDPRRGSGHVRANDRVEETRGWTFLAGSSCHPTQRERLLGRIKKIKGKIKGEELRERN